MTLKTFATPQTLRALIFALVLAGTSASGVLADHMGNHLRPLTESSDSTTDPGFACGSDEAGVLSATEATETAAEDEAMPAHRRDGRPW